MCVESSFVLRVISQQKLTASSLLFGLNSPLTDGVLSPESPKPQSIKCAMSDRAEHIRPLNANALTTRNNCAVNSNSRRVCNYCERRAHEPL